MKNIFIILCLFLLANNVFAQQLAVDIDGHFSFDNSEFTIDEAGEDFKPSIESESSIYMSVIANDDYEKKINKNKKWSIYVHKEDMEWHNDLKLEIKRTGKGTSVSRKNPKIFGGESYQNVTNNYWYFFRGKGETVSIPLSIRLSGYSVVMGAGNYETKLVITVYENW